MGIEGMENNFPSLEEERLVIAQAQAGDRAAATQLYTWFGIRIFRQVILSRLLFHHL